MYQLRVEIGLINLSVVFPFWILESNSFCLIELFDLVLILNISGQLLLSVFIVLKNLYVLLIQGICHYGILLYFCLIDYINVGLYYVSLNMFYFFK